MSVCVCVCVCVCVSVLNLVIVRLSHSLSKVTVHQRLVDEDGLIYSLEKIGKKKRYEKRQEHFEHA